MRARVVQVPAGDCSGEQARKQGIWFTARMQAAVWQLAPGQQIVAHCHPQADSLINVMRGRGEFFAYEEGEPNPEVCYSSEPDSVVVPPKPAEPGPPSLRVPVGPGSIAAIPAGEFYGLVNIGQKTLVVSVATAPDPAHSVRHFHPGQDVLADKASC